MLSPRPSVVVEVLRRPSTRPGMCWIPGLGDVFYGWIVLGVAMLSAFLSGPGQTFGVAAFIESYVREFDWTRSEVSFLYLIGTCVSASLQTSLGLGIDRLGPRQSVMIFAVCLSLACYFNGTLVRDKPSLAFGFFMVRLFGQGGMSLVPKTVVPRWFVRRRGIAMGLLSIGWMVSQAVLPAVNSTLIDQHGYRTAWKFWAACVLVMVPVAGGLMIDDPLHVGLCPDGNGGANPTPSSPTQSRLLKAKFSDEGVHEVVDGLQTEPTVADTSLTPETALKQPQFYALAFAQLEGALVHTAVTFHAFSIVGHSVAPGFLAARSVVGLPTNLIAGWSVDHVGGRAVMIAGFGIQVVGLLLLTHAGDMEWVAVISGGLLGASSALVNIAMSTLIPSVFGVKHLGAINGLFSSVGVFGSAIGPWVFGVSADSAGTWQWSLWGSAIYAAGCVGVTATLKS